MSRRPIKIELAEMPAVGLAILVDGQRFDLIGHEGHIRQDGKPSTLLVWQAKCATCGEGFVTRSGATRWTQVRRCEKHRQPGKRVGTLHVAATTPVSSAPSNHSQHSQITVGACPAGGDHPERITT